MIPARYAPYLFGFLLSGMMSFFVTCVATIRTIGFSDGFIGVWMGSWCAGWIVAFPTVLIVGPIVRRVVASLVTAEKTAP